LRCSPRREVCEGVLGVAQHALPQGGLRRPSTQHEDTSVWDHLQDGFSRDPEQKYLYVADGTNNHIWILDRNSGKPLDRSAPTENMPASSIESTRSEWTQKGHLHGRSGTGQADPEVRARNGRQSLGSHRVIAPIEPHRTIARAVQQDVA